MQVRSDIQQINQFGINLWTEYDNMPDVGDDYIFEGEVWEVTKGYEYFTRYAVTPQGVIRTFMFDVNIKRVKHFPEYFDYWKVYEYKFLNWHFLREVKRIAI